MPNDFLDAHDRHWDDAERLFQAQRWANADHLYGISAECGLKRLMQAFGIQLDKKGNPKQNDRVHADGIWRRYESYRSGHHQGINYQLPNQNPFDDWHISQRYCHQSNFKKANVQPHQSGANAVRELVKKASMNGLI